MGRVILCVLALISLLGVAYLLLPSGPDKTGGLSRQPALPVARVDQGLSKPARPLPPEGEARPRLTGQALRDAVDESTAKTARLFTPELRRELLNVNMKTREPIYRGLFDAWGLKSAVSEEVLKIVWEREFEYQEAWHKFNLEGSKWGLQWRDARAAAGMWADTQLLLLLGEDQFHELAKAESGLQAEAAARGLRAAEEIAAKQRQ